MNCKFCGRSYPLARSVKFHENYCDSNAERKRKPNQYSNPSYKESHEITEKRKLAAIERNKKPWSADRRKKHSIAMSKAVSEHPDAYTSSNRGRVKQTEYRGIKFHGTWEVMFAEWCDLNKIIWERNTKYFIYSWNGERKYFPDFYLPEKDIYIEVKGYTTDRDLAKWRDFPKKLVVIDKSSISLIGENKFIAPW